jgi:hypothetical protein
MAVQGGELLMDTELAKDPAPPLLKVEASKIIDLIVSKQNQYYALWAGYTAVQFTAASFGGTDGPTLWVAVAVLCGVWAFNLGHLGFVLQCAAQLDKLGVALKAAIDDNRAAYDAAVRSAFENVKEGDLFWDRVRERAHTRNYKMNCFVHLFIDVCASVALILRINSDYIRSLRAGLVQLIS